MISRGQGECKCQVPTFQKTLQTHGVMYCPSSIHVFCVCSLLFVLRTILCLDLGPRGRPRGGGGWGRARHRRHAIGQERSHENVHAAGGGTDTVLVDARASVFVAFSIWSAGGWGAHRHLFVPCCALVRKTTRQSTAARDMSTTATCLVPCATNSLRNPSWPMCV